MTLSDYLSVIRKRWIMIVLLVAAACAASGYAVSANNQPIYQATSKIIVNQARLENGKLQLNPGDVAVNGMLINTFKELIKTPAILQSVVKAHPDLNVTTGELVNSLKVSTATGSQIMSISIEDPSYERASQIVNAVAAVFRVEAPAILNVDSDMIVIPSNPDTKSAGQQTGLAFVLLVAFVASFIVSVFLAYLLEYFDTSLREPKQVEQWLGIPVMAGIPEIRKSDIKHVKQAAAAPSFKRVGEDQHVHING
ncbi:hypothetical protein GE107_20270 [Cohnella sp. CFH 77786]|uniref:YveK family protein n=1 Tax=Cohnella sp. CFH 77786 TaxID=2662265 RepID=UPI001C60F2BE|nr:Wzz/FepE/Etk N-terminal domain-containing protein [Cohnella sp. CFH 77786]MBW5448383.1 hypothetical protein [Cohnella sp. CFH 77786]